LTAGNSSLKMVCCVFFTRPTQRSSDFIQGNNFEGRPAPTQDIQGTDDDKTKRSLSKTAQKILKAQKQPPGPVLFVGNLGFETSEDAIRNMIEAHQKAIRDKPGNLITPSAGLDENSNASRQVGLRKIRMGTFEDSGKCKG
jgi:hypothetical protein